MFKSPNLRKCFVISHSRPNRSQKLQAMSLPIRWRWLIMVIYCLTSKPFFFRNFLILILLHFRIWHFFAENVKIVLSESWETLIMHLSVFVFVFCLQLYLFLFVYLYFWPILSRPKCDYGEHRRRSDLHIWGLPPSSVCRNSYFRQQPEKNKEKNSREILEKF